jgi:DNA ligase-1
VQSLFRDCEGLDGELIVGSPTDPHCFANTTSGVMSENSDPKVSYYVFDNILEPDIHWHQRFWLGCMKWASDYVKIVPQTPCFTEEEVLAKEKEYVDAGYEGLVIRDPNAPYKYGRSTVKEGYLLKLKRYLDSEALVLDYSPLLSNTNEAKRNELGKLERSNCKAGMVALNQLGTIKVKDLKTGVVFNIGSGFTEEQRKLFDYEPDLILGKIVKYKYFPVGVKELPRHPVFLGIRDERDL